MKAKGEIDMMEGRAEGFQDTADTRAKRASNSDLCAMKQEGQAEIALGTAHHDPSLIAQGRQKVEASKAVGSTL